MLVCLAKSLTIIAIDDVPTLQHTSCRAARPDPCTLLRLCLSSRLLGGGYGSASILNFGSNFCGLL
jgi:hypothetical protein